MTENYYMLDTCIWMDFYEERFDKTTKPIGKYAFDLFIKMLSSNSRIYYSNGLIRELYAHYGEEKVIDMLNFLYLCEILIKIPTLDKELYEATELNEKRNLPFFDCLLAVQARNNNAILITRDKHFFNNLSDITLAKKPESIF